MHSNMDGFLDLLSGAGIASTGQASQGARGRTVAVRDARRRELAHFRGNLGVALAVGELE